MTFLEMLEDMVEETETLDEEELREIEEELNFENDSID
jgi:hypothetical protein